VTETKARNATVPTEEIEAAIEEALAAVRVERFGSQEMNFDMSKPSVDDEFTPEQWKRIRAHIKARGIAFEVFLPESLANWLREKIANGAFKDAAEAAFVAFQDLQELDRHPEVREQLLRATIEARLKDPRPGIPLEDVRAQHRAQLHEWANTETPIT
jgi:Arc/MetJ-type ribon-helix-helix transcriptional regulator